MEGQAVFGYIVLGLFLGFLATRIADSRKSPKGGGVRGFLGGGGGGPKTHIK